MSVELSMGTAVKGLIGILLTVVGMSLGAWARDVDAEIRQTRMDRIQQAVIIERLNNLDRKLDILIGVSGSKVDLPR